MKLLKAQYTLLVYYIIGVIVGEMPLTWWAAGIIGGVVGFSTLAGVKFVSINYAEYLRAKKI